MTPIKTTPNTNDPIPPLRKDLKASFAQLTPSQARYLVDHYYAIQEQRKATGNQVFALTKSGESCEVIQYFLSQSERIENEIKNALDNWTRNQPISQWARSIPGIGPVIAAGLQAHIDIRKAPTVGHIWSFAGLNPNVTWEKGQKRPWNADLKVLCWKIGESFVKLSGRDNDIYGKVYVERKAVEQLKNDRGDYAEQAAKVLTKRNIRKETEAYKWYSAQYPPGTAGAAQLLEASKVQAYLNKVRLEPGKGQPMLPPAHIHSRSKRYAVKLFLAHWHHVAFELHFNEKPPKPYIIEHGGHTHFIAPPNWPLPPKKAAARKDTNSSDPQDAEK